MEGEQHSGEPSGGLSGIWIQVIVFVTIIVLPLFVFGTKVASSGLPEIRGENLRGKLRSIEDAFGDLPMFEQMREQDQALLTQWFSEGNSRVVVGGDSWLHYRADIEAVIGKGPFYVEPPSVARAPGQRRWQGPLEVIPEFAEQLRERGIQLTLVPVPVKSMMVSLDGEARVLTPDFYGPLLAGIEKAGVEVVDLVSLLDEPGSFLKQDTHWTPRAMERVAESLARTLGREGEATFAVEEADLKMTGDLVTMLVPESSRSRFPPMDLKLRQVSDPASLKLIESDPLSPWVLLGDSFVNVFDDPALGFSEGDSKIAGDRIGAGFAGHLMRSLGRPLHVMARNGSGATGVRKAFASLPDDVVKSKERVIWVLSARDLMLAEITGRRAGIEWERVEFSDRESSKEEAGAALVVTATLREQSFVGNPETTPYASAVYSTIFGEIEVEQGSYASQEAHVFLWAFRDREIEDSGRLEVGLRYRLELSPFPASGPASRAKLLDDFFLPELTPVFADTIKKVE